MKHLLFSKILAFILISVMISGFSNTTALPNGAGVQQYNPGVGWNDFAYIKGDFTHAIFDWGGLDIAAGTWLSIIYGVTSGAVPADTPDDELIQGIYDFVFVNTEWYNTFDGVDITEGLKNAILDHDPVIGYFEDEEGNLLKEVFIRAAYYIVPQSIGCYEYYGSILFDDGFFLEVSNDFCWVPRR